MRAALYARVSDEEQVEGYSLDAQRRAFRQFCEHKEWNPYREYVEEGVSARTDDMAKEVARRGDRLRLRHVVDPLGQESRVGGVLADVGGAHLVHHVRASHRG